MGLKISKKVSINKNFYNFLRPILGFWFKHQFNLSAEMTEEIENLSPPFLLLPNHQGFWDPFMAGLYIKHPVFYITSDAVFRYPLLEFFMKLLGAIPKKKAQSDLESIKHIMKIRDAGGVIGVFPEGRRTWDGTTLPIIYSTSKLIKLLKIPVVTALFKGGYYSQPRWGKHIQKGKVHIEYKILFRGNEIRKLSVDDIQESLTKALNFDEIEYQKTVKQVFKGKNPAENMEQALYMCPSCKSIGKIRSAENSIFCSVCGYTVTYNPYRSFQSDKNTVIFDNIRDWIRWQNTELKKNIMDYSEDPGYEILSDKGLTVERALQNDKRFHRLLYNAEIVLTGSNLNIKDSKGKTVHSFSVKGLHAVNVQNKEKLDFYYDGILYNIYDSKKRFSAYKWLKAVSFLQTNNKVQTSTGSSAEAESR